MNQKQRLFAALAVTAMAAVGLPGTAAASTTAGAKLVNVVEVEYSDASGNNTFHAAASTTVTVNLVKSALNASTAPSGGAVAGLGCLGDLDTVSGGTVSAIYALSATANGSDSYDLSIGANTPSTTLDASDIVRNFSTLAYDGTVAATGAQARVLGSAIPVGISGTDTLLFPGGALAGFEPDDIVLVEIGPVGSKVKKAYKVLSVDAGSAATHPNADGVTGYTSGLISDKTAEAQGSLKLEAYNDYSIVLNGVAVPFGGGNDIPAFDQAATAPTLGVPVGELVLVKIDITASASSVTADGFVGYTLAATNGTDTTDLTCTAGFFRRAQLSIKKEVRTLPAGGWGGTAAGKPGDILEYRVTVANPGGQAASVKITDAVPVYTTLVTHSAVYGDGTPGTIFAQITDGVGTVTVTTATDSEAQASAPYETGYGEATGTTANSAINFFLGDTSDNANGGTVPSCSNVTVPTSAACTTGGGTWLDSYTILYQVKID